MPQKANPIGSESTPGMAGTVTSLSGALLRAVEVSHERSGGEWLIEWQVIPQIITLTAGCLKIMGRVIEHIKINPDRMLLNLEAEHGRTLAEAYMFELAPRMGREAAHDVVYKAALESKLSGVDLYEAVLHATGLSSNDVGRIDADDYLGESTTEAIRAVEMWNEWKQEEAERRQRQV